MARKLIAEIESSRTVLAIPPSIEAVAIAPRGLALPDAAKYSGLTIWALRTLVWNQTIPAQMQGKRIIILREHLDKFLTESQRTNSIKSHLRLRDTGVFKRKRARANAHAAAV
jgi:hypothetical protein